MKKKRITIKPLFFLFLLMFIGMIGTTFSYIYQEIVIPNKFKTMTYNVSIEEEFYDTWGTKKVTFKNNEPTSTPIVLRISYHESWRKTENGVQLSLDNNIGGVNVVQKNWTNAFLNDFIDGNDGWYYYKKVLGKQQSVQVLDSINLNNALIQTSPYYNEYLTYTYQLDFNYEAIQADRGAIQVIWGKSANINGGNITWT